MTNEDPARFEFAAEFVDEPLYGVLEVEPVERYRGPVQTGCFGVRRAGSDSPSIYNFAPCLNTATAIASIGTGQRSATESSPSDLIGHRISSG
jgi:hypothetical protein